MSGYQPKAGDWVKLVTLDGWPCVSGMTGLLVQGRVDAVSGTGQVQIEADFWVISPGTHRWEPMTPDEIAQACMACPEDTP